jgi:TPR repeat protein
MEQKMRCPYCGEEILAVAKKCRHCGEWLDKQNEPLMPIESGHVVAHKIGLKKWMIVTPIIFFAIIIGSYLYIAKHQSKANKDVLVKKSDPVINFAESDNNVPEEDYQKVENTIPIQTEQEDIQSQNITNTNTEDDNSEELLILGENYEKGIGVEENHETAFYYYEKAAKTGNPSALNKLGNMYAQGKGCTKDVIKAASCYLTAAEMGNKYAQHNIAFCYWDGVGVERNRETAVMWMRRSASQGYEKAKKALKIMGFE